MDHLKKIAKKKKHCQHCPSRCTICLSQIKLDIFHIQSRRKLHVIINTATKKLYTDQRSDRFKWCRCPFTCVHLPIVLSNWKQAEKHLVVRGKYFQFGLLNRCKNSLSSLKTVSHLAATVSN